MTMLKKTLSLMLALCLGLCALPALAEEGDTTQDSYSFGVFSAENVRGGEAVTQDIFAQAEITLVNFWATWCGPCRQELPALAQYGEASGGRFQVLGVLVDSFDQQGTRDEEAIETALTLMDEAACEYPVVVPDLTLLAYASSMQYVPTTFFVDSNGDILGYIATALTLDEWLELTEDVLTGNVTYVDE